MKRNDSDPDSIDLEEYCLYCAIGAGVIPAKGGVLALGPRWTLNAERQRTGRPHYILQTRRHVPDFDALDPEEAADMGRLSAALVAQIKTCFEAERVTISYLSENRPPHAHLRFIPRFFSDLTVAHGLGIFGAPSPVDYEGPTDMAAVAGIAAAVCEATGYEPPVAPAPDSPEFE